MQHDGFADTFTVNDKTPEQSEKAFNSILHIYIFLDYFQANEGKIGRLIRLHSDTQPPFNKNLCSHDLVADRLYLEQFLHLRSTIFNPRLLLLGVRVMLHDELLSPLFFPLFFQTGTSSWRSYIMLNWASEQGEEK